MFSGGLNMNWTLDNLLWRGLHG